MNITVHDDAFIDLINDTIDTDNFVEQYELTNLEERVDELENDSSDMDEDTVRDMITDETCNFLEESDIDYRIESYVDGEIEGLDYDKEQIDYLQTTVDKLNDRVELLEQELQEAYAFAHAGYEHIMAKTWPVRIQRVKNTLRRWNTNGTNAAKQLATRIGRISR